MAYELYFHPLALKEWHKLPKPIKERFKKVLEKRLTKPHIPSASLRGELKNCYKIKFKSPAYRLVYSVDDHKITVTVIAIGKREREIVYQQAKRRSESLLS